MLKFSDTLKHKGYTYFVDVPASTDPMLRQKGYIPVKGTINGCGFKGSLAPRKPDKYVLYLHREIRTAANLKISDVVHATIQYDAESRDIAIPDDVELIIRENEDNWNTFLSLSQSRRNEWLQHILEAKKAETRLRRIDFVISRLIEYRNR